MFAVNIKKTSKSKILYIFKKTWSLSTIYSKCGHEYEKIFKDEEFELHWALTYFKFYS